METTAMAHLLIIEDEPGLVLTLTDRLQAEGYDVSSASDGAAGLAKASQGGWDLILLDWMLPKKSGIDVCRELRRTDPRTPVLMLTARGQTVDKVVGLQLGADDYMTKPFEMVELLARVAALLRRSSIPEVEGVVEFGGVRVDRRSAEVTRKGERVALSAREYQLLRYLLDHRGETVTREDLLREVWGYQASMMTRTVDVHMTWLRQKLEQNPRYPRYFLTVRGMGYRLAE
jgi:two-component system alkaline phosphatase synthesis response regulator PhoP